MSGADLLDFKKKSGYIKILLHDISKHISDEIWSVSREKSYWIQNEPNLVIYGPH